MEHSTELTTEQKLLLLHGDILSKLMEHYRFRTFVTTNYEIAIEGSSVVVKEFAPDYAATLLQEQLKDQKAVDIVLPSAKEVQKFK